MSKSRGRTINKRVLARAIGYCSSTCLALPKGRFHLVALYQDLSSKPGWTSSIQIKLSNKSLNELTHFWQRLDEKHIGRSWFPPNRTYTMFVSLFTDASKFAWGAHYHGTLTLNKNGQAQGPALEPAQGPDDALLARGTFD